ncbi:mitogen-activated protein kinase kinase kinase 17-like [Chenopodium quinoa]|uniref:mitogen-activated protein kinase kinase kinase 17-like n=1 Tax=Chenopodium quinoa TaxID=63459 RepID=UPI000B78D84E|nr:mitogen-activated protein kinase kinase kinase 17-like [Chenopodium quinoa]
MEWVRGEIIGRGSFGTVNLAIPKSNSTQYVVKSAQVSNSFSLKSEKEILSELSIINHPNIVRCLGDSLSLESGTQHYNLFLEYASKGSLADQLKLSGGKFEFSEVKNYTKSILKGLSHLHESGIVHCDIKLQNILVFEDGTAKIADFGLAKKVSNEVGGNQLRGTPLYMSPEIVAGGKVESPADVWALGCAVVEMVTGKPAWEISPESDVSSLLYRIAIGGESPKIPGNLCSEGRDFIEKCFIKNPNERWTAQMLLDHPFVSGLKEEDQRPTVSPRCPFDFPDWQSGSGSDSESVSSVGFSEESWCPTWSPVSRQLEEQLVSDRVPNWGDSNDWIIVR